MIYTLRVTFYALIRQVRRVRDCQEEAKGTSNVLSVFREWCGYTMVKKV